MSRGTGNFFWNIVAILFLLAESITSSTHDEPCCSSDELKMNNIDVAEPKN
jgi:hypothetical protein